MKLISFTSRFGRLLPRAVAAGLLLACSAAFAATPEPGVMEVGVARVDITPDYPVRLSGFGGRRTESEGVTQRIWAKALAFPDAEKGPLILITADNVCVPDEITREIARRLGPKTGLKLERLTITATHTHTAPMLKNVCPTLFGVPIPEDHQERINRYTEEFTDSLEQVALAALEAAEPSRLSWGIGTAGFAINRRTPGGPVDHDLPMLAVRGLDGEMRAIYFSYACHCVTLSDNKISGDWAGFAQSSIEELYPGAIALASVGCGADSNPSSGVTGSNVAVCKEQGNEIAEEVQRLVESGLTPLTRKPVAKYARVDLAFAPARSRQEWEKRAERNDAIGYHARVNLERLDRGEKLPEGINYPVQTWIFGDELAIVFMPGETVVDYSLRLKREFDRTRLWVNGYSNDGRCYIPSERVLKEGGYEGGGAMIYYDMPQIFAPGLEQKLIDAVAAQIPPSFKVPPGTEGIPALPPERALRTMRTKPGLKVELVAAEPLISDPVAIDWGPDGRLWVCEMHDYPSGLDQNWGPGGRIKVLEDQNGDGRYDTASLFLDGIPFPTGLMVWGDGVFVCAAPDILYARDTDNDGRADKVEKLFTGFFTDNFQARVNGLSLGLDNWIHGANGLLGGTIRTLENSLFPIATEPLDIRNHDFRFHPARGTLETVSGLSQQGRVRDDWGHWFGCDNSHLLLNFPNPERYIRRNPHVPAPPPVRNLTARPDGNRLFPSSRLLERFNDPGHANRVTSAGGLGIYRDTLLGEEYFGNAFTCESVHNLVHREVLSDSLVLTSRRAEDEQNSEFLSSTDNWFRPVQVRTGPDGALYVVDMYRFLIEHPRWIPAARLAKLDVRAGADMGRIYRVRPEGKPLRPVRDLTKLNGAELAEALNTPNGTDRDRVHAELLIRGGEEAAAALRRLAEAADLPRVRVQALSALAGLDAPKRAAIRRALQDEAPEVRVRAIRASEPFLKNQDGGEMLEALLAMLDDKDLSVLRQLAFTLGESDDSRAGAALGKLAARWKGNAEMRVAILSSARTHAGAILATLTASGARESEWVQPLVATVAASGDKESIAAALEAILPEPSAPPASADFGALGALLQVIEREGARLEEYLAGNPEVRERVVSTLASAQELAVDEQAAEALRVEAVRLLGWGGTSAGLETLIELAGGSVPAEVRRAALAGLRRQRGAEVAEGLLARWPRLSPSARGEITNLLLDRPEWTRALLAAVKAGAVRSSEISLSDRQRLAASQHEDIRGLAEELFTAATGREEILRQYSAALNVAGSARRGAEVFTRACASCHKVNGLGQEVGPDLERLRAKDAAYWLKNILDPNAVVEPRFVSYQIELKDDRSLSGLIRNETATSLLLLGGTGVKEEVLRSQIREIRASSLSLMPEGLEMGITIEQMADLIAFLKSGASRKVIAGNEPAPIHARPGAAVLLPATRAEIYGGDITYEAPFQNIGMWHGQDDYVAWTVELPEAAEFDVHLDYACAASAGGNHFVLAAGGETISGVVAVTGADWSNYRQIRVGSLKLPAGSHRIVMRPEGTVRGALIDLRHVALVPPGQQPPWPAPPPSSHEVLRDPASVARLVLNPAVPDAERNTAIHANPQFAAALVKEMTRNLEPGTPEEYVRIPWIWRVAIACGRRNAAGQLKAMLEHSLPEVGGPFHDWQSVVIGGGIINGLTQRGIWPAERIKELLNGETDLLARWNYAVEEASSMADDEGTPTGTRYDALRMLGMEPWEKSAPQLLRYLAPGAHPELQMGAVSALGDMPAPEAAQALAKALDYLEGHNRELALDALIRNESRAELLLDLVEKGKVPPSVLGPERKAALLEHESQRLRTRAAQVLKS